LLSQRAPDDISCCFGLDILAFGTQEEELLVRDEKLHSLLPVHHVMLPLAGHALSKADIEQVLEGRALLGAWLSFTVMPAGILSLVRIARCGLRWRKSGRNHTPGKA
jgi:hypothetical protein